jgi:aryl-alcohol dehydrogenase-like predicted oxidoreductase
MDSPTCRSSPPEEPRHSSYSRFLIGLTKVCTHGRDAALAMQMLEQSLKRLQTDRFDLWQIHGVTFDNDPEMFIRPGGEKLPV